MQANDDRRRRHACIGNVAELRGIASSNGKAEALAACGLLSRQILGDELAAADSRQPVAALSQRPGQRRSDSSDRPADELGRERTDVCG